MVLQLRQYLSQRLDSMPHVLWASTSWLVRTQNIPSLVWELGIIIPASSFPKVLYLASVVHMHMHQSLFSQDLTEKPSADFQRVNQSFSFSLLCKTILLPSVLFYKYIYFFCLGIPKTCCVSLQFRKTIIRLCLGSSSLQAGSWGHSLGSPHSLLFC